MSDERQRATLTLPGSALSHLRDAFGRESDVATAVRVLDEAGRATGEAVFDDFAQSLERDPEALEPEEFWEGLKGFLAELGWGSLTQERVHPGLAVVRASGWAEAGPGPGANELGCAFSSGMFSGLFTRLTDGKIAVREVSCRGRGEEDCVFVFGSQVAVERLGKLLPRDGSLDEALRELR